MCGITGYVSREIDPKGRHAVERMTRRLIHRGPDDSGIYTAGGINLGHRRLSILDLSPKGHQPMVAGDAVLTFNGEIYNYRELRAELESLGISFNSNGDTEVLLKSYLTWGIDCIRRFRGMFAFAIWDGHRRRLICGRDPFGKKPFYYHFDGARLIFASEPEALVTGLTKRPELDAPCVAHYLLKGYMPLKKSIYQSINTLPPANVMTWDLISTELKLERYVEVGFNLAENSRKYDRAVLLEECEGALKQSVRRRLASDVPIGTLLSGGVDSSLVTMLAAESSSDMQKAFTISFDEQGFDETPFASQVAAISAVPHHIIEGKNHNLPSMLDQLLTVFGEPFGDPSAIPSYLVFNSLKNHVTVALTGDGGDEVFAGYKGVRLFHLRKMLLAFSGATDLMPMAGMLMLIHHRNRRLREAGYFLAALREKSSDAYYMLHQSGWTELWRKRAMRPEMWRATDESQIDQNDRDAFVAAGKGDLERYLNMMLERLAQYFLVKIDRTSMANSIEARSPMLDADLISLTQNLSSEQLVKGGEEKSLLKEILETRMGREFSRRKKMGFTPPLGNWLASPQTRSWLEDRLTDPESLSYAVFKPESIRQLLNKTGGTDHSGRIWKLIFLNEWHRKAYL